MPSPTFKTDLPKSPRNKHQYISSKRFVSISSSFSEEKLQLPTVPNSTENRKKLSTVSLPANFQPDLSVLTTSYQQRKSLKTKKISRYDNEEMQNKPKSIKQRDSDPVINKSKDKHLKNETISSKKIRKISSTSMTGHKEKRSPKTDASDKKKPRDKRGEDRRVSLVPVEMDAVEFSKKGDVYLKSLKELSSEENWLAVRSFEYVDSSEDEDEKICHIQKHDGQSGVYCCTLKQ